MEECSLDLILFILRTHYLFFLVMERGWFFKHLKLELFIFRQSESIYFCDYKKVFFTIVISHYTHV